MQANNGILPGQIDDMFLIIPMALGALIMAIGGIWFLIRAFMTHIGWGLAVLFLAPFAHIAYFFMHFKKALWPAVLMIIGLLLMVAPIGYMILKGSEITKDAIVQSVPATSKAGNNRSENTPELRITLTGAKREDYAQLKNNKKFAVIQWANKDVTDDDTELLHGMELLRELDLNDTAITDDALHVLEDMPKLEILRLARTAITEEGFKEHIQPLETLMELDLRGTKVPAKLAREWKAAKPGRKLAI